MNAESEFLKAFELVAAYDAQRPKVVKEYRLYYNEDGSIIGLWETDHPAGDNYVVLDDTGQYHRYNTNLLRVVDKKLTVLDPAGPLQARLKKSTTGFRTVQGHAALVLEETEQYTNIEYYDRTNN
jgi:hypothetical protein